MAKFVGAVDWAVAYALIVVSAWFASRGEFLSASLWLMSGLVGIGLARMKVSDRASTWVLGRIIKVHKTR
jgi:hypothetical protein